MRLFVMGATGKTGRSLVAQGLGRGHSITAFGRSPFGGQTSGELDIVVGNPMRADEIATALPGHDAVLSVLGTRGFGRTSLLEDAARATIEAMDRARARRLIILSSALSDSHIGWLGRFFAKTLLRHHASDQQAMETLVTASNLDWTILRPARLTGGPLTGRHAMISEPPPTPLAGRPMTREDVARLMLETAERVSHLRQIVWVGGAAR